MPSEGARPVTGTMLRDVVVCERRAWHDVHTSAELRDPVSSFVELLWAEGIGHERGVLAGLEGAVDLRAEPPADRRRLTLDALRDADAVHILGGEIVHGDLLGRPDLISRLDGEWVAGDVKAGTPFMANGRSLKVEYAVQVGLYARILEESGLGTGDRAFVIGADGERVVFDADGPCGRATMAVSTANAVERAREIHAGVARTRGESSAKCGLCHWRTLCRIELDADDDLTLVAELGRKLRGDVEQVAPDRTALANLDVESVVRPGGRTDVPGLGADRLRRFQDRARLQLTPGATPYAREPLGLDRPTPGVEWHLDIEADPTRGGYVYLHGIWERRIEEDGGRSQRFVHFSADGGDEDGEREAFAATWAFLQSDPTARVYYFSRYERTSYRALQRRHPDVCTAEAVEAFFSDPRVIDLYTDVVRPKTEWSLSSYGIKPIAKSLGFFWAAEDASGASSIAWYDEYARTASSQLRDKIVDYNRSDCQASAVVLDALITLPVGAPPWPPAPVATNDVQDAPAAHAHREETIAREVVAGANKRMEAVDEAFAAAIADDDQRDFYMACHDGPLPEIEDAPARRRAPLARPIYATPTLRPCAEPIAPGGEDGIGPNVARDWSALREELPLLGGDVMRPTEDGGIDLCDRLRHVLPWMAGAIGMIERQLQIATWAGRPWLQWRPMLLVGDPGVGKSHLARQIGRIAGVPAAQLDLGGMHDSAALVPTARGWSSARPCWPATMMAQSRCANPVLTLDEIDKAGGSRRNGDPLQGMLAMLEASTAAVYHDTCLMTAVDLSAVCWIATANDADADALPRPLRSRLDVVEVPAPEVEHVDGIVASMLAAMAGRWAVPVASMPEVPARAMAVLRDAFARHRSIRRLRRHLDDVVAALTAPPRRDAH